MADRDQWLLDAGAMNGFPNTGYLPGDFNLDGSVDVSDFNIWNSNKFNDTAAWCAGDGNLDGVTDVGDFNLWNNNRFLSSDHVQSVPEPSGMLTILTGLLGLGLLRRRK